MYFLFNSLLQFGVPYLVISSFRISYTSSNDLFFVVQKYEPLEFICVTNSSAAITWYTRDGPEIDQAIVPRTKRTNLKKTVSKNFILDRRWEELNTDKTIFRTNYTALQSLTKHMKFFNLGNDFKVPISVWTSDDVDAVIQIFLCENNKCYNFKLTKESINVHKCTQTLANCETVITQNKNVVLNAWNHYMLSKQGKWIELTSGNEKNNTLKFFDNKVLNGTSIVVATSTPGVWKIHENEFSHITTSNEKVDLLKSLKVQDDFVCFSMFLKTCGSCQIKLQLTVSGDEDYILKDGIFGPYNEWTEVKFAVHGVKKENVDLSLVTIKLNTNEKNQFWSYSNIEQCHHSEFRMIRRKDYAKCQLMSEGAYNILDIEANVQNINYGSNHCKENTVSSSCVPCSLFTKNITCGLMKISEKFETKIRNSCSAGYKMDLNQECRNACSRGFFGFDCQQKCGRCRTTCNSVNGTCPRCAGKYTGNKCDTPRGALFKMAPTVTNVKYTTASLIFRNFDLQDVLDDERATSFIVEYKVSEQESWVFYTPEEYSFGMVNVQLSDLKPGTKYFVRGVIKTDKGTVYTGDDLPIPYAEFKTICDDIKKKNFELDISPTSVNLSFVEETNTCKTNNFNVSIINVDDFSKQPIQTLEPFSNFITINKLIPRTQYKMLIYVVGGKPFRIYFNTNEEISGDIKNSNSSVTLPRTPNNNTEYQGNRVTEYNLVEFSKITTKRTVAETTQFSTLPTTPVDTSENTNVAFLKTPTLSSTQNSIAINISTDLVHFNGESTYELTIIMERNFGNEYSQNWVVLYKCELKKSNALYLTIGVEGSKNYYCSYNNANQPLKPSTLYNIKIIVNHTNSVTTYLYNQYTQEELPIKKLSMLHESIILVIIMLVCATVMLPIACLIRSNDCFKKALKSKYIIDDTEEDLLTQFNEQPPTFGYNTFKRGYYSKSIKTTEFVNYVQKCLENGDLVKQHKTIVGKVTSKIYETVTENLQWDYIYLGGDVAEKTYIVCEMPKSNENVRHFWDMVWSENINFIVFLDDHATSNRQKSEVTTYGDISVQQISCKQYDNYSQKKFHITRETTREINQLHLSTWTKNYFPISPSVLTPFFQKIIQPTTSSQSPILVMSNPGMDGAGFVLLCDVCLRSANNRGVIDVLKVADILANYNLDLITDAKNYVLAHMIILENILYEEHTIDDRLESLPTLSQIDKQFDNLENLLWLDQAAKMIRTEVQFSKNMDTHIYLPYSVQQDNAYAYTDMLNLVRVDGFRKPGKFIVTQQPTKHSATYFWTTLQENKVNVSVILHTSPERLKQCVWFPTKQRSVLKPSNCDMIITHRETKKFKSYLWISVEVESHEENRKVDIFFVNDWLFGNPHPCSVKDFVRFYSESRNKIVNDPNPVMITCWDGRQGSGLYIALSNIIEQTNVGGKSDISRQVRLVKSHHQQFLKSQEQFRFLWDAVECYIRESAAYEAA